MRELPVGQFQALWQPVWYCDDMPLAVGQVTTVSLRPPAHDGEPWVYVTRPKNQHDCAEFLHVHVRVEGIRSPVLGSMRELVTGLNYLFTLADGRRLSVDSEQEVGTCLELPENRDWRLMVDLTRLPHSYVDLLDAAHRDPMGMEVSEWDVLSKGLFGDVSGVDGRFLDCIIKRSKIDLTQSLVCELDSPKEERRKRAMELAEEWRCATEPIRNALLSILALGGSSLGCRAAGAMLALFPETAGQVTQIAGSWGRVDRARFVEYLIFFKEKGARALEMLAADPDPEIRARIRDGLGIA